MGLYIELGLSETSTIEQSRLIKAIGDEPYGYFDENIVILISDWVSAKIDILKQSKKFNTVFFRLVKIEKGELTPLTDYSEVFSDEFLEMERSLVNMTK